MNSKYIIYLLYNKVTGDRYIGSTTNLSQRRRAHFSDLRLNKHGNPRLQKAFNIYGEDAFEIDILQTITHKKDLLSEEQRWISLCNPEYNITSPEAPFSTKAYTRNVIDKSHKKLSKTLKVHYKTKKGKARAKKQSETMKKLWASGEFDPRLSHEDRIKMGRLGSIAQQATGYKHSEETKRKIGDAHKKTYAGAVSPDGIIYAPIVGMQDFCEEHNLNLSSMVAVMHNRRNHHKGWTKYNPGNS